MYRLALDGKEKSIGKSQKDTKSCAFRLGVLYAQELASIARTRELVDSYPFLLVDPELETLVRSLLRSRVEEE